MSKIKSMADQIRDRLATVPMQAPETPPPKVSKRSGKTPSENKTMPAAPSADQPGILEQLNVFDQGEHKSMVHARLDAATARMLGHFKMATGHDANKVVAFAVTRLFQTQPELRDIIKQFIENFA